MDAQPLSPYAPGAVLSTAAAAAAGQQNRQDATQRLPRLWDNLELVFGLDWSGGGGLKCVVRGSRPKNDILIGKFKPNISSDGQQPFSHILQAQTNQNDDERQFKNRNNL